MKRDNEALDAIVIIMAMAIIGFAVFALIFFDVPETQLAVVAGIVSGLSGTVVGAYAGYRWATSKQAAEAISTMASRHPQQVEVINTPDQAVPVEPRTD